MTENVCRLFAKFFCWLVGTDAKVFMLAKEYTDELDGNRRRWLAREAEWDL